MLESGRGTSPARAAAATMSDASTAGWSRQERHARSSGCRAAAGKPESGARSGMSTARRQHAQYMSTVSSVVSCRMDSLAASALYQLKTGALALTAFTGEGCKENLPVTKP